MCFHIMSWYLIVIIKLIFQTVFFDKVLMKVSKSGPIAAGKQLLSPQQVRLDTAKQLTELSDRLFFFKWIPTTTIVFFRLSSFSYLNLI